MRFVLRLLLMIVVALAVGFGLSYHALTDGRYFGAVQLGAWVAWPDIGAPTPNPYTRAHIARDAAFQLGRSEGLQFIAGTDDDGEPLDLACAYLIEGRVPVSAFWTLAAVDGDWINIAAPDTDAALRSSEVARLDRGLLQIRVGTRLQPLNWLEVTGSGPFRLVLTLYDTTALSGFSSADMTLPAIKREDCT